MGALIVDPDEIVEVLKNELYEQLQALRAALNGDSLLFFGRPWAGKDLMAEVLALLFGDAVVISSGELARSAPLPPNIAASRDRGDLIPSEDFFRYVLPQVGGPQYQRKILMLSSIGRVDGEQQPTMDVMAEQGHPIRAVVYVDVREAVCEHRCHKGRQGSARADDDPKKLANRLAEFNTMTLPVIGDYESRGMLIRIDGEQYPDLVARSIVLHLFDMLIG